MSKPSANSPEDTAPDRFERAFLLGERGVTIIRYTTWIVILLCLLLLTTQSSNWYPRRDNFATHAIIVACLAAYAFLHFGYVQRAVQTLTWSLLIIILLNAFVLAGVRTPALIALSLVISLSAWLSGLRDAVRMTVASTLALSAMALMEVWGYKFIPLQRPMATYYLILLASLLITLAVSNGAFRSFMDRLAEVWDLKRDQDHQLSALRVSEERFSALFRASPIPSSTNDRDGRIIDVNEAWETLWGVAREQALGKTAQEAGIWTDPDDRRNAYQALAETGCVDGMPLRIKDAQGQQRPFLIFIAPVEFGGEQRFVTNLQDQTDRHAAEKAQRAVQEELEARVAERTVELSLTIAKLSAAHEELVQSEKLASLGSMVAGISHELNTPIGNTMTVSTTLQDTVETFKKLVDSGQLKRSDLGEFLEATSEMATLIERSTQRAAELISSFKQVAVDMSSERRREFALNTLVHDIVTSLRHGMRKRHVEMVVQVDSDVACDSLPGPIGQIITNLVQNALTHGFVGEHPGTITVSGQQDGEMAVLCVQDNGVGMSEHTRKHCFDPFFTTRLGQGGSGLGLSVSYRLASTVLRGSLSVQSSEGQGSTFTLRFLRRLPFES